MTMETAVNSLLERGLLGVLLVICFGVIIFLYKENDREKDERLSDMKDVWQADVKYREELKSLIQNVLDLLRGGKQK